MVLPLALILTFAVNANNSTFGFVHDPVMILDKTVRGESRPYLPQPGDILLFSDDRLGWTIGHNLAKTGKPHHSAVVFRMPDGTLWTAQAGSHPETPSKVGILPLEEHLRHEASRTGRRERDIWVRQRKVSLSPEQSDCLTDFALEATGRRFARVRMFFLMTPLRPKGPWRTAFVGKVDFEQRSYFCSEFVVTALAAAGALDPELVRPAATFPRDLFFGTSRNPWVSRGLKTVNSDWEAPARWSLLPQSTCLSNHATRP
jgi:hypothetical protein